MRRAVALAAFALAACRSEQSFVDGMTVMCSAATPTRIAIDDPVQRDQILMAWIDDHVQNDDARAALRAMTEVAPAARAPIVRAAATAAGVTACALADYFANPPAPRTIAAPEPAADPAAPPDATAPVVLDVSAPRAAQASVEIGGVTATGALTSDQVHGQLTPDNLAAVARCYPEARGDDPGLRGELTIAFVTDGAGHPTGLQVTGLSDALDACVTTAVGAWQLGAASGTTTVAIRLELSLQS